MDGPCCRVDPAQQQQTLFGRWVVSERTLPSQQLQQTLWVAAGWAEVACRADPALRQPEMPSCRADPGQEHRTLASFCHRHSCHDELLIEGSAGVCGRVTGCWLIACGYTRMHITSGGAGDARRPPPGRARGARATTSHYRCNKKIIALLLLLLRRLPTTANCSYC